MREGRGERGREGGREGEEERRKGGREEGREGGRKGGREGVKEGGYEGRRVNVLCACVCMFVRNNKKSHDVACMECGGG